MKCNFCGDEHSERSLGYVAKAEHKPEDQPRTESREVRHYCRKKPCGEAARAWLGAAE